MNNVLNSYKIHFILFSKLTILIACIGLIERIIFAIYHNHLLSPFSITEITYTLIWGIRFDLALSGFFGIISVFITYPTERLFKIPIHSTIKYLAYIFASCVFFIQAADIIYFADSARHLGYEITDTFIDATSLLATAWTIYKAPFLVHIFLYPILLVIISKLFKKQKETYPLLTGFKKIHIELNYFVLIIVFLIMGRGGLQSIPIEPLHAQEISNSAKASIALNGAYNTLFFLVKKDSIKHVEIKASDDLDLSAVIKELYLKNSKYEIKQYDWNPNIIYIFLESWPSMYMQSYGYEKVTTPFFDTLRKKSLTSQEMIAGGHRTTEGMFSSLCSAQNPLGQTVAQSQLQDYPYHCLPHILRNAGYKTFFFQGSNKNTSGTGAFAQSLGFTESFGKADISKRTFEENYWGVYDQDLYEFAYKKLLNTKTPFLIGINTNTTHDVVLPKNIVPQFKLSNSEPKIINSLNFADKALENFFNKIENNEEIKDVLWVIVADHTAGLKSSRLNNYRVPFLIYHKTKIPPQLVKRVASQRDIAPTILSITNKRIPDFYTGKPLNHSDNPPYFADYYHSGTLGWIENDILVEIQLNQPDNISCYKYIDDKLQKNNVKCSEDANILKNHAIAFTKKSQNLLFSGNLQNWLK